MNGVRRGPGGLYRRNGWLFGVCGGLADYFGLRAGALRLILLISAFFTAGVTLLIYLALAMVMKRPPFDSEGL